MAKRIIVFIHRSIKTRIETTNKKNKPNKEKRFLYIDPLKQGLKLDTTSTRITGLH